MKKTLLLITFILGCIPLLLGNNCGLNQRMSPEEFREKQQSFMAKEAGLTKKEASAFFPVFFELQEKKASLNRKAHLVFKRGENVTLTEKDYKILLDELQDIRSKQMELESVYYKKFVKILSYEKLYKLQQAETTFHRQLLRGVHRKGRGRQ